MRCGRNSLTALALVSCWLAGCGGASGPAKYPVAGEVTYAGQPVAKGEISFIPVDGGAPDGGAIENGKFSFRTTMGKKRVEIRGSRPAKVQANPEMGVAYEDFIPAKFNRESTLTAEVTGGSAAYTYSLTP